MSARVMVRSLLRRLEVEFNCVFYLLISYAYYIAIGLWFLR